AVGVPERLREDLAPSAPVRRRDSPATGGRRMELCGSQYPRTGPWDAGCRPPPPSTGSELILHATASAPTSLEPLHPTAVLFDLDGTITDSGPVITDAIAETLAHFGYPAQTREELRASVTAYRRRYSRRLLQAPVYPGMADLIRDLPARGVPLALATSKRRSLAVVILQDLGLSQYFAVMCGASEDESRAEKADI